jgi:hypothetical protein
MLSVEQTCENCKHVNAPISEDPCRECWMSGGRMHWQLKPVPVVPHIMGVDPALAKPEATSDGSSADYYVLPLGANQLQDLIAFRDMNAQIGEIFRACYRYGKVSHSAKLRDAKKMKFYAEAEIARLEKYET